MIFEGRMFPFLCLVAVCGVILFQIERARKGMTVGLRKLPALDSLEDGIGRATEMGRPVHFSSGWIPMSNATHAPMLVASMEYLAYVSRQCAKFDTKLIITVAQGDTFAVTQEIVRNAYLQEGVPENLRPDTIRFLSSNQLVYASATGSVMEKEQVATNIMIGGWADEALFVAEAGYLAGAMGIGGTTNQYQIPFFVAACDSVLLSDELFAGSAYLSKDPVELGAVAGQDWGKTFGVILLIVGAILKTLNVDFLVNLMSK